jgi:virulence-associated protein VagC
MAYVYEVAVVPPSRSASRPVVSQQPKSSHPYSGGVRIAGQEAMISRDGDRLIIEPVRKRGLATLLDSWAPLDEELPEIDDPPPTPRDIF